MGGRNLLNLWKKVSCKIQDVASQLHKHRNVLFQRKPVKLAALEILGLDIRIVSKLKLSLKKLVGKLEEHGTVQDTLKLIFKKGLSQVDLMENVLKEIWLFYRIHHRMKKDRNNRKALVAMWSRRLRDVRMYEEVLARLSQERKALEVELARLAKEAKEKDMETEERSKKVMPLAD